MTFFPLPDPEFAEQYVSDLKKHEHRLERQETETVLPSSETDVGDADLNDNSLLSVWTTKGKGTEHCHEATQLLIELRGKYNANFADKKTNKMYLWKKIAEQLRNYGYNVNGKKCQQKFANLQKNYLKFKDNVQTTGAGKKEPPPYYEEMHGVLGMKDKSTPRGLQDSFHTGHTESASNDNSEDTENQEVENEEVEDQDEEGEKKKIKNRFRCATKIGKPKTVVATIFEEIKSQMQQERIERQHHFEKMETLLETQNAQRERMLNLFERIVDKDSDHTKKRKMSSELD